jgi:hypothetical protein
VSIALNGLVPSWMPFVQGVCAERPCQSFQIFGLILCRKKSDGISCSKTTRGSRCNWSHWEDKKGRKERLQEEGSTNIGNKDLSK